MLAGVGGPCKIGRMSRRAGALAAFLLSLVAYALTAAPSIWWLDSSEFAAASFELGISHPPGHALALLFGRLCMLLPLGSLAFRANLASALASAGAAAVLFVVAWDLSGSVREAVAMKRGEPPPAGSWSRGLTALGAALLLSLSLSAWMQATRAEVYALNLLLLLVALQRLLAWDRGDETALGQAAFSLGLGLANHHLLVLLFTAIALPWALARRAWRPLVRALGMGLLGACALLYLPLRAARWPEINWGAPVTAERLGWLLSASAFARTAARVASEPLAPRVEGVAWLPVAQLGVLGTIAALGGLYLLLRLAATRRAGLLILGAAAASAAGPLMVGFDPFNPDAHGYLLMLLAAFALGAAAFVTGAETILRFAARPRLAAALGPTLLCLGLLQGMNWRAADLRAAWSAEETALEVAGAVPTGGVLHTALYKTVFNLWYLRIAEGLRPDLRHLHVGLLGFPGYRESVARKDPSLLYAPPDASEYYEAMTDDALRRLGPAGPVLRDGGSVAEHRTRMVALERRCADGGENEASRSLLWSSFRAAQYFCRVGNVAEARREIARARRRSTSPMLDDLLARCGR